MITDQITSPNPWETTGSGVLTEVLKNGKIINLWKGK